MEKKLGILVLHGMGSQSTDFAEPMIKEVNKRLTKANVNVDYIAWEPVFWADVTEQNELRYLRNLSQYDLDFMSLRKFVVKALGDAVAYQDVKNEKNQTYELIHNKVSEAMSRLYQVLGNADKPLMIMAHSLGGAIISNYIWDNRKTEEQPGFMNFDTLKQMITFGCNLPLFSFAYNDPQATKIPEDCTWTNYYDKDDILGYPLKPISQSYDRAVTEDIEINVGNILGSWNPMSHSSYWTDNDFTKAVTQHIIQVLG